MTQIQVNKNYKKILNLEIDYVCCRKNSNVSRKITIESFQ